MTEPAADVRVRVANRQPLRRGRGLVLYWMIAARRPASNHALDRAVAWAVALRLPLVVLEPLRLDYPWASDRLHRFVIDGMRANAAAFARAPVLYYPYVEPSPGAGRGLLEALASRAAIVVTDEFPCFFLPRMVAAAARSIDVRLEAVDGNGLLPLAATSRTFAAAAHFRWYVQKTLPDQLRGFPAERPFAGVRIPVLDRLPAGMGSRWPAAARRLLNGGASELRSLAIDHGVPPAPIRGGHAAARRALTAFVSRRLDRYAEAHNHPDDRGTSRLSPYLHFGHLSAFEVFNAVMRREKWSRRRLPARATGSREGWWRVSPGAQAFLDQLVVWRELAYNMCATRPDDYDRYETLPAWAAATLEKHATDPRPHLYTRLELETARTHDPLWNAAQRELRRDGWFHNYVRMLWGKKILEWSETPQAALDTMTVIMNRWALDGRNPNSYAGFFWVLGRYDRPWPERPVYGRVRSMSSERTAGKVRVTQYLRKNRER